MIDPAREYELFDRLADLPSVDQRVQLQNLDLDLEEQRYMLELLELDGGGLEPGVVIDERYVLAKKVGTGGSSEVWLARDQTLERNIALKVFDFTFPHRVVTEAQRNARIVHESVVRVHDVGEAHEHGRSYISMEFIGDPEQGGRGASTLSNTTNASLDDKLRAIEDAAWGVNAAHRAGIIHRDVKPDNILLEPHTGRGKITDFGLAHSVDESNRSRGPSGTPPYMAPEQARGEHATEAVDIYGLGASLYHVICGSPPYTDTAASELSVLEAVVAGAPTPLSALAPNVSTRLLRIVETAMASDPARRYASAEDFASDLAAYRMNRPTSHERDNPLVKFSLAIARNKPHTAAALLAALWLTASATLVTATLLTVNASWGLDISWRKRLLVPAIVRTQELLHSKYDDLRRSAAQKIVEVEARLLSHKLAADQIERALHDARRSVEELEDRNTTLRKRGEGLEAQREALAGELQRRDTELRGLQDQLAALKRTHQAELDRLRTEQDEDGPAQRAAGSDALFVRLCTDSVEFSGTPDQLHIEVFGHTQVLDTRGPSGHRHLFRDTCRYFPLDPVAPQAPSQSVIRLQKSPDSLEGGWKLSSIELFVGDQAVYHSGVLDVWLSNEAGLTWTSEVFTFDPTIHPMLNARTP